MREVFFYTTEKEFFMFHSSLLFTNAIDKFTPIAKWLTIALAITAIILCAVVFLTKKERFEKTAKCVLFVFVAYLLILGCVFFALDIAHHYSDAYAKENWLDKVALIRFLLTPLLIFCFVCLCSLLSYALIRKYKERYARSAKIGLLSLCGCALLAVFICLAVYYEKKIKADGYYNSDTAAVKQLALYLSAILTAALVFGLTALDKQPLAFSARTLAYAGICVSMSYALSYVKLWDMPQGGSITLVSLLPLMLFSYLFGIKKGVFIGFAYGTLQALQDPWIIHPAQFALDYPVAFAAIGLAGLFNTHTYTRKSTPFRFTLGAILAGTLRFACHFLSGVFAFEAYAKGQNAWAFSLVYNSYVFIDVALVIAAGVLVLSSKSFIKQMLKTVK